MESLSPEISLSRQEALEVYRSLLYPRRIEKRMLQLLRQNKLDKWFSGIGQEAVSVGITRAVYDEDYLLPMHRNLGVFTSRKVPLYNLFCQLLGKADGFTGGRDRTFHFGLPDYQIVGMISHLAANLPVGDGLALSAKLRDKNQIAIGFCGEGATSEGDFHEALNLAAVWQLPIIFLIENNGYALSTPTEEQFACEHLADRADGYGIRGAIIDGNDIFEVMKTIRNARETVLREGPMLIEAKTFRLRGHEEASGTWYVPDKLLEKWQKRDPIHRFEQWLSEQNHIGDDDQLEKIKEQIDQDFEQPLQKALNAPAPAFDRDREESDVWTAVNSPTSESLESSPSISSGKHPSNSESRLIDGIQQGLRQAFREDDTFIMMGQDIAEYGGVFKVTEGFLDEFGRYRIRNTPIIESGIIGTAIGLALEGFKPVVEMQFADFISCGMNQLINNAAKGQWRWMPSLNITVRGPHGAGVGAGPFHSASPEGWFMPHAGLKIVIPSTVEDAKNLTYSALYDPNPVLIFEHKKLYRSIKEKITEKCRKVSLQEAKIRRQGEDAVIVTYGLGVYWAQDTARKIEEQLGYQVSVLDLRSLQPIDFQSIDKTVRKTHKVLLLQEPSRTMGPMSEVSSYISEHCFEHLDAPIVRCSSIDTPVPSASALEERYLPKGRLYGKLEELLEY